MWKSIPLTLFLCFSSLASEAKVIETKHIEDVLPLIDEDTWFLVDLDNCMFEGAQALGHADWFYDEVNQRVLGGMSREDAIMDAYPGWVKTQKACRVKPIEENFVPVLKLLEKKGVTIMGLTHRQPSVADSTVKQVASLGFDFERTAPSEENFVVTEIKPSLYKQGILFVGDYNKKNAIFEAFLARIHKKPKKVVFIDDKKKNVDELEELARLNIEYVGVHYRAIEDATPVYDRQIAEYQMKFLDQIMSNEAAELLMESRLD